MERNKYTDSELGLMSYQELRRLSILLRLPANIKKKYMISMIQAHQKGDSLTKTAICSKVKEERQLKQLNRQLKQANKSFVFNANIETQQVPADLSVSSKHEFETRYSYVAHYTTKDSLRSGISGIIKQEAEVSRRNRGILQHTRKTTTRKLASVERTEIMLPRNHSLTTPVRVMPQHERTYIQPSTGTGEPKGTVSSWKNGAAAYETVSSPSGSEDHFQEGGTYGFGSLPISTEYANFLTSSSAHEIYRNQPYWHAREVFTSPNLVPVISGLLTPNSSSPGSSPTDAKCNSNFQQGSYEKFIRDTPAQNDTFEPESESQPGTSSSGFNFDNNEIRYGCSRDGESAGFSRIDNTCGQMIRGGGVIRHTNCPQYGVVDVYLPSESEVETDEVNCKGKDLTAYNEDESPLVYPTSECVAGPDKGILRGEIAWNLVERGEVHGNENENGSAGQKDVGTVCQSIEKTESFLSDISEHIEATGSQVVERIEEESEIFQDCPLNRRCHFLRGHDQNPDSTKPDEEQRALPPFMTVFSPQGQVSDGYSVCGNSLAGTKPTPTHLYPIMTSGCTTTCRAYQIARPWETSAMENGDPPSPGEPYTNGGATHNFPRALLFSYPGPQLPYMDSSNYSAWNDPGENSNNGMVLYSGGQEVQVIPCRLHRCHYIQRPATSQQ